MKTLATLVLCLGSGPQEEDVKKELPRLKATDPAEALKKFTVAPGTRMELVAAEPVVVDPVDMAFDEEGRLWVVEMIDYPFGAREGVKPHGRLRLLRDGDGDGRFDSSSIQAQRLAWPTGLCLWDGGAFVAAAPHIYYVKDRKKEIVFTGFLANNVQGLVNNLTWGPDNWIYGAGGSNGGVIRSLRKPDHPAVPIKGRDFRFRPTGEFEAISGGSQFGFTVDPYGRRFVCSNSRQARHVVLEDRFLKRNPYLPVPAVVKSISSDGDSGPVFRDSPAEPWRVVRTRMRVAGKVRGPIEHGGKVTGYFTSATGITWHKGRLYIGDVASNLIHRKRLTPVGATFRADRIDEKSEFVSSPDNWFRPANFADGPDGALYVCDMYRECIEHPYSIPEIIKKHLDLTSGKDRGRIWRLIEKDAPPYAKPHLKTPDDLVRALKSRNPWHRRTAARLIYQRQETSIVDELEELGALWILHGLGKLRPVVVARALKDDDPGVREQAVRLSRAETLFDFDDPDPRVRLELAYKMGETKDPRAVDVLARLAKNADVWVRTAVAASSAGRALALLKKTDDEELRYLLGYSISAKNDPKEVAAAKKGASPATLRGLKNGRGPTKSSARKAIVAATDRGRALRAFRSVPSKRGDPAKGREIYKKLCMQCHKAGNEGQEVGPAFVTVKDKTPEELMVQILDPNREINQKYVNHRILTKSGVIVDGILLSDTATSVTLRRAKGETDTILKVSIEKMITTGVSLMPEGLEKGISVQDMADLIAFIRSQKPEAGSQEPKDPRLLIRLLASGSQLPARY